MSVLGLDLGMNKTGYCAGDGSTVPRVGGWRFPDVETDLGELGTLFRANLRWAFAQFGITHCMYEAPLITPHDKLLVMRKILGLGMVLETECKLAGVVCEEVTFAAIKKEMTGGSKATKDDVVEAAERLGVTLPRYKTDGREDAADACGAWLIGVRHYAKQHRTQWDRRLFGSRFALKG